MILKGSQRSGALQLARHLLRDDENDHVEVHELRGFASQTLTHALHEVLAISKGTQCRQFLFSLSLNPPAGEDVPIKDFEVAVDRIEEKLGLSGQPRAVVFHEKEGRRHAHCVWSRINAEEMKAIPLSHFKRKLQSVSRELFLEHGWRMPRGMMSQEAKDPTTFTQAEWQQAKRVNQDPKRIKALFQECWAASDSRAAFSEALRERGYVLARGDRRAFVAVDFRGEIYAIAKWTGIKTKEVKARLGEPKDLPTTEQARADIAARMSPVIERFLDESERALKTGMATLALKKSQLRSRHRGEREWLRNDQAQRWQTESQMRAARFRKGFRGLWDRFTSKHRQTARQNEEEATKAQARDRTEREAQIAAQLGDRRELQQEVRSIQERQADQRLQLQQDAAHYLSMIQDRSTGPKPTRLTQHPNEPRKERSKDLSF